MDEEERESGITFGEICRLIGKKIWAVLGAAAAVTVIAVLLCALVFNPLSTCYSMSFELIYPTSAQREYPDGTPFSYRNIISRTMLEAAKHKDEKLASVDVVAMLDEGDILIDALADEDGSSVTYSLTVQAKYFPDGETAQLFIRSVADAAVDDIMRRASALSYGIGEEAFNGNNFEARLDLLEELYSTILSAYDRWISTYSAGYQVTVNGTARSLADFRAEVYGIFVEGARELLAQQCAGSGYSLLYGEGEELEAAIEARVEQLRSDYQANEKIIASLKAQLGTPGTAAAVMARSYRAEEGTSSSAGDTFVMESPDPTLEQRIAYYTEQNALIESQLGEAVEEGKAVTGTLTLKNAQAFADKLAGYFEKLNQAAENLTTVTAAIYRQNTFADFLSQTAESDGETSVALVGVAAFIIAFLAFAAIVCAVEYNRRARAGAPQGTDGGTDGADNANNADNEES